MWWLIVVSLVGIFLYLSIRARPQVAIGITIAIAYLFPAWLLLPLFEGPDESIVGSGIDIKVAVGTACLILYCFMPGRTFPLKIIPGDLAIMTIIAAHLFGDIYNQGFEWMTLARAYAEWYLPYVCGRLAVQSRDDIQRLWPVVVIVGIALALGSTIEAFTNLNPWEWLFGERPLEGFNREAARWGIQRAYGPAMHPIYFGVIQVLMLGWAIFASLRGFQRRAYALWVFAPVPVLIGICATASRGPILGIALAAMGSCFLLARRSWQIAMTLTGFALLVLAVMNLELIVNQLEVWSGEAERKRDRVIEIDDQERVYTGTRSRLLVYETYRIALRRSGLLGFGTDAVSGFPINVPVGPREAKTLKANKYVDNAYVLLTLRFGYLGLGAFLLACLSAVLQFAWITALYRGEMAYWFAGCTGGAVLAALGVLFTVWMPHEIGFLLLWSFGISSGMVVASLQHGLSLQEQK